MKVYVVYHDQREGIPAIEIIAVCSTKEKALGLIQKLQINDDSEHDPTVEDLPLVFEVDGYKVD